MSALSDYLENEIADHILGGGDFTRPSTVYVALFTSAPSDSGGGTEVSAGGYARSSVTNNATNWPGASGGLKANGTAVSFAAASASWGTVTHFGVFDASSGGNLLFHGSLDASKIVENGDTPSFGIGTLSFQFD